MLNADCLWICILSKSHLVTISPMLIGFEEKTTIGIVSSRNLSFENVNEHMMIIGTTIPIFIALAPVTASLFRTGV